MKLKSLILAAAAVLCLSLGAANAQTNTNNPFAAAPAQYQTLLQVVDSIPTVELTQAGLFIDTGAYNGPSVNTQSGQVSTVLQNYVDADLLVSSNVLFGGELRNVINHVDYTGIDLGYNRALMTNMLFNPMLRAGYDLDNRAPQAAGELGFRYHPFGGSPYLQAAAGYAETIGTGHGRSHSGGGGEGRAAITLPLP